MWRCDERDEGPIGIGEGWRGGGTAILSLAFWILELESGGGRRTGGILSHQAVISMSSLV